VSSLPGAPRGLLEREKALAPRPGDRHPALGVADGVVGMRGVIGKLARAVLLASLALAGTNEARAATDWLQYIASHGDLIRAFGTDEAAGERHYLAFGRAEGRLLDGFDESRYLAKHPDLRAAFGADARAATVHYILHGFAEGRTDDALPASPGRNILLIIADDFGVDVAAFYPTTASRRATTPPAPPTPNLARLARQGVLFRDAWGNMECSPTRATIMTGRYGFRTGVGAWLRPGYPPLPLEEFSLAEAFAARPGLGYELGHVGKWHLSFGLDDPNAQGWRHSAGMRPGHGGMKDYWNWEKVVNGVRSMSGTYATTDQVDEAVDFIGRAEARGRPYLLWLAFNTPHAPYHRPPNGLHSRDYLPLYAEGMDPRPYYEAMIEAMDTEIGRLLESVDLATTTVVFVGDNGTPGAVNAPPYATGKSSIYEGGVRVPLLVAGAGVRSPGRVADGLVNTVDLYPTILQLAGIDSGAVVPRGTRIDGVSLLPYLEGTPGEAPRATAYSEKFHLGIADRYQRAMRDRDYKLVERAGGGREFYNLRADPFETTDLLPRPLSAAESGTLIDLQGRLDALLATR
jgi:arylsulfatase A-like enzyme